MSRSARIAAFGAALVVAAAASAPTGAQTAQPDTRPPCARVLVAVDENVDSARAKSGDVFKFVLVDDAATPDGTRVPAGTPGYGVVAISQHADKGGRAGYLAVETRFFLLPDGRHVPAIIDRANDEAASAVGSTANAPGILGLIPIVGYAVGGYDAMHHGRDATIQRGTRVGVFLGDDAALGACRPPKAGESPPPMPTPSPVPAATPAAPPALTPTPSPTG
ncbi:MAG TPA: hypothetical protein VGC96_07660 [Candidatus Elarobacter sp.]